MHDNGSTRACRRRHHAGLRAAIALLALLVGPPPAGQGGEQPAQAAGLGAVTARLGKPWAWGWNLGGQLGRGTHMDSPWPGPVDHLEQVVSLAAGGLHSLALTADGTVWAWGGNTEGQVGSGSGRRGTPVPVRVPGLDHIVAIATGALHNLALRRDGTVWTWGSNAAAALGSGHVCAHTTPEECTQATPQRVAALPPIIALAGGGIHSLALAVDGRVWAWGANRNGQLGTEAVCHQAIGGCASTSPVPVRPLEHVVAIAGGGEFSLALTADGAVWAWGANGAGQLGRAPSMTVGCGPLPCSVQPLRVLGLPRSTAIAAGDDHALALDETGRVWTWGGNAAGQLGRGTAAASSPRPLGLTGVVAIAGGRWSSAAMNSRGTLWTWGGNAFGQLGNGTTATSAVPRPVRGLGRVVGLAAGSEALHRLVVVAWLSSPLPAPSVLEEP